MELQVRETLKLIDTEITEIDSLKNYFNTNLINEIKKMDNDFTYLHSPS